jgi:hypothetical protein
MATYYQFGPNGQNYRGRTAWLGGAQFTPTQQQYYMDNPEASFALALSGYPGQGQGYNISGQNLVAPQFRRYVEKWIPEQYKTFQGQVGMNPPGDDGAGEFFLRDYLPKNDPYSDYLRSDPYSGSYSRFARPTRLLRR